MQAVAIVGAGELGATTARALASHGSAGEIRLIDDAGAVAAGKALDIWQAGAVDGSTTRVLGGAAIEDAAGADIVVMADRHEGGEWDGDAALERLRRVAAVAPRALCVWAGAHQHALVGLAQRELRMPRERVLGTAPEALASAVRAIAALLADASPADVSIPVLGAPPRWVFAWSDAQAAGTPLSSVFGPAELRRLEGRAHASWPPGAYVLGSAAATAVNALLQGSLRRLAVYTLLDGEYGARGVVAALPVRLGPRGVQGVYPPALSAREQVAFQSALAIR